MRRLLIAVDCDDVLVPTTPYFVRAYNDLYGTKAGLKDAHTPDPAVWGAQEEEIRRRRYELTENDEYKMLAPSDADVEVLRRLASVHELHLVTARKGEERQFTQQMLNRKLSGVFKAMDFVGWKGSKGEICRKVKADILIDDNGAHLLDALACGMAPGSAILYGEYPWNEEYRLKDGVVFCRDWLEVERRIEQIAHS